MLLQVAKAMRYMHSKRQIHRDLKSGNVLLSALNDPNVIAKIADFGKAVKVEAIKSVSKACACI